MYVDHVRNDLCLPGAGSQIETDIDVRHDGELEEKEKSTSFNRGTPIPMLIDNSAARTIAHSERWFPNIRHLDVRDLFVRQCTAAGLVDPVSVPTTRNVADIFTKPLPGHVFYELMLKLNGYAPL